jgi:hypothetical protein
MGSIFNLPCFIHSARYSLVRNGDLRYPKVVTWLICVISVTDCCGYMRIKQNLG